MMKRIGRVGRGGIVVALALLAASGSPARAGALTYGFSGRVLEAQGVDGVQAGDPVAGTFTYDPDAPKAPTAAAGTDYQGGFGLQFTAGSKAFGAAPGPNAWINVRHQPQTAPPTGAADPATSASSGDYFLALHSLSPRGAPTPADLVGIKFQDPTGAAFPTEALPTSLDLARTPLVSVNYADGAAFLAGQVTALSLYDPTVPEPATWAVLALGFAGLVAARRRHARARS